MKQNSKYWKIGKSKETKKKKIREKRKQKIERI
jgi:hypothetical protein